jgi:cysteine-rich repeat protein
MSIKGFVLSGLVGLLGLALFIPTQGCSSSTGASGERICTPGANVFCRCADRSQGTKLCADDGKSFATACSTDESRTECAGGEIDDPDTGKTVDDDGNIIDDNNNNTTDGGSTSSNSLDSCPGKSTSLTDGQEVVLEGDTTSGKSNTEGTGACAAGAGGNEHIYRIIPTGSGAVNFTVKGEGAMNPTIYLRSKCDDKNTQLRCAETTGAGGTETFSHNMVSGTEYFLVVDGAGSSAGKYKVTAKLTAGPFCGDGKVQDGEACDDINKTDNDGCSPSCQQVNGNPAAGGSCPGHQVELWSGKTVTGTGSNNAPGYANTFSQPSVSCSLGSTNNVTDHVYQINPRANGYVTISLTSSFNHNIVVRKNSCTDAASTTAAYCKDKTQTVSVPVTSGTPFWVAVDGGSLSNNVGDYTITFKHFVQ